MATRSSDKQLADKIKAAHRLIIKEVQKVIVGQTDVVEQLLWAIFARGHCLLIGVPGLAKTLLVQTIGQALNLQFNRIQFTPDLMPSDITGTEIITESSSGKRRFTFIHGPVFSNIILADEINRAPPKTQSALLEAMQEKSVTVLGKTYQLDLPFFVLATQNPIEQEGTYPLPEAQLDRFMFNITVEYPNADEEREIVKQTTTSYIPKIKSVLSKAEIIRLQNMVMRVPAADYIVDYAVALVRMTRPNQEEAPSFIQEWIKWGAGPRASQYLILSAKARAIMAGRFSVAREDIDAVAPAVLRHRMITNFNAEADNIRSDEIVQRLIEKMKKYSHNKVKKAAARKR